MDKYETLVQKAKQAYKEENLIDAALYYEEAFIEEVHLDDLLHLGSIYIDLKKYNKAIEIFNDIIKVQGDNFLAYYGLATCYNDLGRSSDAINAFKIAIEIKHDYADAYFGIGLVLDYQDDDECEFYYLKTIEYDKNHYWAHANLGPFYDRKENYEEALKYALRAYELDSNGWLAAYNLGVIYSKLKDYDEAYKYYLIEIAKGEVYIEAYLNLGLLYKDIYKDYPKAQITYLEGIAKDKDNVDLWYNLGCLYVLMDRIDDAYNSLLYANLKNIKLREFMENDKELEEFRKTSTYQKLLETINGN